MRADAQRLETPSLEPDEEIALGDNDAFVRECLSLVDNFGGWQLGRTVLTRSERWGLVWRADFTISGADLSPLLNRIVCWELPSLTIEVAIGQRLAPLPKAR
jgi:hypothetical protein